MPTLVTEQGNTTSTIIEKAEFLQARFYLTIKTDLTNIKDLLFLQEFFSLNPLKVNQEATKEKIKSIIKFRKLFKILKINSISNSFL